MAGTTGQDVRQQRIAALQMANAVRREKAELKRDIARGNVAVRELLRDPPPAADRRSVRELLMSQRHWGRSKTKKLLARSDIAETKLVGELTERQRELLADQLGQSAPGRPSDDLVDARETPPARTLPQGTP